MKWWPRRKLPTQPAWMHCGCDLPVYGRIAHWLMRAQEQTDLNLVRFNINYALLIVRRAHHRRNLGSCCCDRHP